MNQESLLKTRRFLPLMVTQAFGAFNDNVYKTALTSLLTITYLQYAELITFLLAAVFILPYFIFSVTAGQVADKYNRARVVQFLKCTELVLMLLVCLAFYINSPVLLGILLFLLGTQSSFFGPIKYALLPQQLKSNELIAGNAYIEASTYVAIILGIAIGMLFPMPVVLIIVVLCSLIGLIASSYIPSTTPINPDIEISKNIFKETVKTFNLMRKDIVIFRSVLGATWFWMIGTFVIAQVFSLRIKVFNIDEAATTILLLMFSIGVGCGSYCCNKLLRGVVQATYVPISALGMSCALAILYYLTKSYPTPEEMISCLQFLMMPRALAVLAAIFFLSFCGGLYVVPLNAMVQSLPAKENVAKIIVGNNIINSFGMVCVSVFSAVLLTYFGFSSQGLFIFFAVMSVFVSIYILTILPHGLAKTFLQAVFSTLYRVNVRGLTNLNDAGERVLFVANHVSLLDALLIAAYIPGRITFAINTKWARRWYVRPLGALVDLFPIDPTNTMALRGLVDELKHNKRVMIFPEGRITVTGALMKIYSGAGVIATKAGAKLVPIRIDGAQFSKFSYLKKKLPTRFFPKISLSVLPARDLNVPEGCSAKRKREYITNQLYNLMAETIYETSKVDNNLFSALLDSKKIYGKNSLIVEDTSREPLSFRALVRKSYVLGHGLKAKLNKEKYVGVMLPNSVPTVLTFFGLLSADLVPAMINFSSGTSQILSCIKTTQLSTIITSKKFIKGAKLEKQEAAIVENGVKFIYLEDLAKQITLFQKIVGLLKCAFAVKPKSKATDTAAILFTSGSEGTPKAVFLSHKNFQANRYQVSTILDLRQSDVFFNALPMFHSFGLGIGTLMTILSGVRTFFYPSPLHYKIVPELIYDTNTTIFCGTNTFLDGYARMANAYDFFALRHVMVGAEKLQENTARIWMEKFGIRILEGYGATEASPVISINTPMYQKQGSVGRLIPKLEYKLETIPEITDGAKLWISGDNVMQGYMRADNPGVLEPLTDGWYDTGDIVSIDEDGFVFIKGRAKRFAKLGGEMVSLTAVEEKLNKLYPNTTQGVVCIADAKKGEKMVLITASQDAELSAIRDFFRNEGLSELWVPSKVIKMAKPPLLGSGKFDYQSAKKIALEE